MQLIIPRYSAYSTNVMANYRPRLLKSVNALEKAFILKGTAAVTVDPKTNLLKVIGDDDNINTFAYPIHLSLKSNSDRAPILTAALDLRNYVDKNGNVRNQVEVKRLVEQLSIEHLWQEDPMRFGKLFKLLIDVFSVWTSSALTRRYGYQIEQTHYMKVIMALYYVGLTYGFDREAIHLEELRVKVMMIVSQALAIPATYVKEVMDYIAGTEDGEENLHLLLTDIYSDQGEERLRSPLDVLFAILNQLEMFHETHSAQSFYSAVCGGAVLAPNAVELGCILVESPPNLLHSILRSERLKGIAARTGIGRATLSVSRRHPELETFVKYSDEILKTCEFDDC